MKTPLTIDDDVAAMLGQLRKRRDTMLKHLVNEALYRASRYGRSTEASPSFPIASGRFRSCKNSQHPQRF